MVRRYNRKQSRTIKEAKGSGYDMLAAFEDKLQDMEDSYYGESLDESVSDSDVRELVLYITNKADLYPMVKSTISNMKRKRKSGRYDDDLAVKAWQYVADAGVKMYDKEFGSGDGRGFFLDKPTRKQIAIELKNYYDEDLFDESVRMGESSDKKWLNTEVTKDEYKLLKKFLVDNNIKHEASGAYNMIHVEVYVDEYEKKKVNDFLDTLDEGCHSKRRGKR